ncbi:MAG: carbonic anhydrase [Acidobacteriota bacterium]
MKRNKGRFMTSVHCLGVALLLVLGPLSLPASSQKPSAAKDPIGRLRSGNARFMKDKRRNVSYALERSTLITGQKPYATVLSCADSRIPPEIVFDESLGKLFVVRAAGNVVDPVGLGSIEYSAYYLGSQLLLVLGHDSCGAVEAACGVESTRPPPDGHSMGAFVELIKDAVETARRAHPGIGPKELVPFAVEENVRLQLENVKKSPVIRDLIKANKLTLKGAVYRLKSGKVDLL